MYHDYVADLKEFQELQGATQLFQYTVYARI